MIGQIANIGKKGRLVRLLFGLAGYAVGGIALAALVLTGVDRWWRLTLFLPFAWGGIGVFQATSKT